MPDRAHVRSIESLRRLRAEVLLFRDDVSTALASAMSEVDRTAAWLRDEIAPRWTRELRTRTEELGRARSAQFRQQAFDGDWGRASVDERKAVERATRRLEEAEAKLEAARRWARVMDHEATLFRGHLHALSALIAGLPKSSVTLKGMVESLEAYLALQTPAAEATDEPDHPPRDVSRGGGAQRGGHHAVGEHRDDQRRHGPVEPGLGGDEAGVVRPEGG